MNKTVLASQALLLLLATSAHPVTRLVPQQYATIQAAIDAAADGDEIIVAPGIYTGDGNRDIEFKHKAITVRSTDPNDPNIVAVTIIDCNGTEAENHRGFYFHSNEDGNSVLSGFTIMNGYAYGDWLAGYGGGILCYQSSPIITNCAISWNSAVGDWAWKHGMGGGIYSRHGHPTISNCIITNNWASAGGGIWNAQGNLTLFNCIINRNSAHSGGGMLNWGSSPTLTDCTFSGNSVRDSGGGMHNLNNSNPTLTNCILIGNLAYGGDDWMQAFGGGMYNHDNSGPVLVNCTFSGNSARDGGDGMYNLSNSNPTLTNCIFWGDTPEEIYIDGGIILVTYSNIQGGWPGLGNIIADPCFVEPGYWDSNGTPDDANDDFWVEGDYHLKSEGWRWDSKRKRWDYDEVTSRCIDAGNPGSPLENELLSVPDDPDNEWGENLRVNMGAYGGTAEASMPPNNWALLADITNDGTVDLADYARSAAIYTDTGDELPADFDRDGDADLADIAFLTQDWLKATTWHE